MGLGEEAVHGLARGGAGIMESVGTIMEAAGTVGESDWLRGAGYKVASYWASQAEKFPRSTAAEGNLWENPSLVLSPRWMTASLAETVPSIVAAMLPAVGAMKYLQVGGKAMRLSPALILKLSRVGAAVTGGAVGGTLEGSSTYQYVKEHGGTDDEAVKSMALMSLASAGLNALSFGTILGPGGTLAGKVLRAGSTEAVTEWLEEPTEGFILDQDVLERMRLGLNVVPASFLTGGALGGGVQMSGETGKAAAKPTEGPVAAPAEGVGPGVAKQPWEMTRAEFHAGKNLHGSAVEPTAGRASPGDQSGFFTSESESHAGWFANSPERNAVPNKGDIYAAELPKNPLDLRTATGVEKLLQVYRDEAAKLDTTLEDGVPTAFVSKIKRAEKALADGDLRAANAALVDAALSHGKAMGKEGIDNSFHNEAVRRTGSDAFLSTETDPATKKPATVTVYLDRPEVLSHKAAVSQALSEGKPVPPEVLADYPELAGKVGKAAGKPTEGPVAAPAEAAAPGIKQPWEMTREDAASDPRLRLGGDMGESIARVDTDGKVKLSDAFFEHDATSRKEIWQHEMAHRAVDPLSERFWRLVDSGVLGKFDEAKGKWRGIRPGRNPEETLTQIIADARAGKAIPGKPVPPEVLAEYPELAGKVPPGGQGAPTVAGQKPGAIPAGTDLTVNLKYVGGVTAIKRGVAALNTFNSGRMAEARATVSHEQTIAEAADVFPEVADALAFDPETGRVDRTVVTSLRDHVARASSFLDELDKRIDQGDQEARQLYEDIFITGAELERNRELASKVLARGLEAHKIVSEAQRPVYDMEGLADLAELYRGSIPVDVDGLRARVRALKRPEQRRTFMRQLAEGARRGESIFYEAWINGLLSSPATHVVNMLSNSLTLVWTMGERAIAGQLPGGGVAAGEAAAMLRGVTEAWTDGLRVAGEAFRNPEKAGLSKLETRGKAISAQGIGLSSDTGLGLAIDMLGEAIRTPGRALIAADAFFKAINYRAEMKALALREATSEGLTGKALAERVAEIEANPPGAVDRAAKQFALINTFQNDLGPWGQKFQAVVRETRFGRLVLPFVRTPTNLASWTIARTPGLQLMQRSFWRDIQRPGPARDLAIARVTAASLTAAGVATLAASGNISGGGPTDPELKKLKETTGWKPYSIKVGDTWYSYNRTDPIGMTIGLIADTADIAGQIPEPQMQELAMAVVLSLSRNITSKTWLMGLSNAIEAITNPDQRGKAWSAGFARSLVPAGVRAIERKIDPAMRETETFLDELKAGVPGWSKDLPPTRNLFGEPVLLTGGLGPDLISPIYQSPEKRDPVADEIVRVGVRLSMPGRVLFGTTPPDLRMKPERVTEGIELTPKEYDQFVHLAGHQLKDSSGKGMKESLAELFKSDEYRRQSEGPDGGKALLIQGKVSQYREAAKMKMIQDSADLRRRLEEKMRRKAEALRPQGAGTVRISP